MRIALERQIDLCNRDRFRSLRLCLIPDSMDKPLGLAFFPKTERKFEAAGVGSRIPAGPAVKESPENRFARR
jgi:hypothetical protein